MLRNARPEVFARTPKLKLLLKSHVQQWSGERRKSELKSETGKGFGILGLQWKGLRGQEFRGQWLAVGSSAAVGMKAATLSAGHRRLCLALINRIAFY